MSALERREFVASTLSVLKGGGDLQIVVQEPMQNVYYICGFLGLGIALSFEYDI